MKKSKVSFKNLMLQFVILACVFLFTSKGNKGLENLPIDPTTDINSMGWENHPIDPTTDIEDKGLEDLPID